MQRLTGRRKQILRRWGAFAKKRGLGVSLCGSAEFVLYAGWKEWIEVRATDMRSSAVGRGHWRSWRPGQAPQRWDSDLLGPGPGQVVLPCCSRVSAGAHTTASSNHDGGLHPAHRHDVHCHWVCSLAGPIPGPRPDLTAFDLPLGALPRRGGKLGGPNP